MSIAPPTPSTVTSLFPLIIMAPAGLVAHHHRSQRIDTCCHHHIVIATARIDPCHCHHCPCHCPWHHCMSSIPILLSCCPLPCCLMSLTSSCLPPAHLTLSPTPPLIVLSVALLALGCPSLPSSCYLTPICPPTNISQFDCCIHYPRRILNLSIF